MPGPMLALVLVASPPAGVELRWDAPPECPDAASVTARIAEYTAGAEPDAPLVIDAKVTPVGSRWRLSLVVVRGESREERELEDSACEGLAESTAVLVAIAIAPDRMRDTHVEEPPIDEPPPVTEPAPPPDPQPPAIDRPAPIPTPRRREPLHVSLRASGGASLGWLPPGGDVALAFAMYWRWLRLEIMGAYGPRRRVRFADARFAGADVSGWVIGARACGVLHPLRWLDLPLCGGVEAGQVIGVPVELVEGRQGRPAWAAGVIAPALRFVVHSRVALWLSPELLIPFTRAQLRVVDEDPLFVSAPVGARLHAGIELRFR
jgi:hypothetical protein